MSRSAYWVILLLAAGCSSGPEPIRYDQDTGAFCRMTITDQRYGAELVTLKGKIYTFDSVECLAGFLLQQEVPTDQVGSLWVTDFSNPPALIPAETARYLQSETLHSPMGLNLTAFSPENTAENLQNAFGGDVLRWDEVLKLVKQQNGPMNHRSESNG